jgi:hypothetical protein
MIRMWRYLAAAFIVCIVIPLAEVAAADCKQPALERFLEGSRTVLKYNGSYFPSPIAHQLPFEVGGQVFQWLGVGWESPKSGALFVLDCSGRRLAATRLGYVSYLRNGPVLSRIGPTVEVLYVAATGMGYTLERVDIFSFGRNRLKSLWTHTTREDGFMFPTEDGTADEYQWRISEDGRQIRVEGVQTVYPKPEKLGEPGGATTTRKLPMETFCWDEGRVAYVACQRPH